MQKYRQIDGKKAHAGRPELAVPARASHSLPGIDRHPDCFLSVLGISIVPELPYKPLFAAEPLLSR